MTVRAKFRLTESADLSWQPGAKRLTFNAEYDDTIPEDLKFDKYTPAGSFTMVCNNPAALAQFKLGEQYYFDIDVAPKAVPAPATPQP